MRNRNRIEVMIALLAVVFLSIFYGPASHAQTKESQATKTRIAMRDIYGELFITVAGAEKKVTDQAQQASIINGGRHVVYSSREGAGGFENEGQSLHVYDVAKDQHQRIMSEYFMVEQVKEVVTSKKKRALLVRLEDGGLGGSYFAVVDPWRGEVFFRRWARVITQTGDTIVLGFYRENDWEELNAGKKVRPYKKERYNLNTLLQRRVIVNKKDN